MLNHEQQQATADDTEAEPLGSDGTTLVARPHNPKRQSQCSEREEVAHESPVIPKSTQRNNGHDEEEDGHVERRPWPQALWQADH